MIPGYTGHVGGLKRTIGMTYGNTTGPLLGRTSPAFIPMHDVREQEKEIAEQRMGYSLWQRRSRPDTAQRKAMRDPISREVGSDIVQRIANQLVSRVNGKTAFPMNKVGKELCPFHTFVMTATMLESIVLPPISLKSHFRGGRGGISLFFSLACRHGGVPRVRKEVPMLNLVCLLRI